MEPTEEVKKSIRVQTSLRLRQDIKDLILSMTELRSAYSQTQIIEKILEVVVPRLVTRYKVEREVSLDGLKIFL